MNNLRRILQQIPLLIIWLMASALLWGFVFTRITDTDAAHKIVICIDAETPGAAELATKLDDLKRGNIRMVQVRPFTYAMLDGSALTSADLFIVSESNMQTYREWFAPCPEGFAADIPTWEENGIRYGIPVHADFKSYQPLRPYINFESLELYYLCFGKESLHLDSNDSAVDNEAPYFAEILLKGSI